MILKLLLGYEEISNELKAYKSENESMLLIFSKTSLRTVITSLLLLGQGREIEELQNENNG